MTSNKFIPAKVLFDEWHKDPEFVREYEALEEEFALASAIIGARAHADLTQEELAERMGTKAGFIANTLLFGYLNHRFVKLPNTIGVMLIALTLTQPPYAIALFHQGLYTIMVYPLIVAAFRWGLRVAYQKTGAG